MLLIRHFSIRNGQELLKNLSDCKMFMHQYTMCQYDHTYCNHMHDVENIQYSLEVYPI